MRTTVLTDTGVFDTEISGEGLWLPAAEAERVTGWTLKPEGMCRDEMCVPLPQMLTRDGRVDIAGFWQHIGNPVVRSDAGDAWVLGTGAEARNQSLAGLEAPDFVLPDLNGASHRLSELRGKKVFLTTWASW
ncbi:MAG: hypothetical protein JO227_01710 [Acetobacteraceae bacterium]|nr:hypothetical protein [Acetobacteraceae bacterium]